MAPFHLALQVDFVKRLEGNVDVYTGVVDGEWCVGSVPNGGYALGLIIEACIKRQANSNHPDPVHVSAHFLRATAVAPFQVHIRQLKSGKGFTNLIAELIQEGVLKIITHQIFSDLKPNDKRTQPSYLTLAPPSSYARRLPLYQHPSKAPLGAMHEAFRFRNRFKSSIEPELAATLSSDHSNEEKDTIGGPGIERGQWVTITNDDDGPGLRPSMLAFASDMFMNPTVFLPENEKPDYPTAPWFPTLTMTLEFKFPIPKDNKTFGLYTNCRFVNDPQGRHDVYVEVWSAPCDLGEGKWLRGGEKSRLVWLFQDKLLLSFLWRRM